MSPTTPGASQLRQLIFYNIDNDLLDNANFLAGRLFALEPRNPDSSHLLALTYLRLGRFKAGYDFSQKYGANGRHLGCTYVFAQACLRLQKGGEGAAALEKAKNLWCGKNNWNKHSDTSRRHVPDAAAVYTLMAKLWHSQGDSRRAGDCYVEAHKANPFIWDAFEGLCKVGADLNVSNMFKPTAEMIKVSTAPSGSSEIYQDNVPVTSQPPAPQTNFNQQVFTPSTDPFDSSKGSMQAPSQFVLQDIKGKSVLSNAPKNSLSEWDTPTANGSVLDEDMTMGGTLVDEDEYAQQPPAAPSRRPRPGQPNDTLNRPRRPALRGHAQSNSESSRELDPAQTQRSQASVAQGQKRTISGQSAPQTGSGVFTADSSQPRRSNRLFGQGQTASTRSTRSTTESTASVAGRLDGTARPSKPATGTKGRIGSTVGRVVSGNRKVLPPDRGDKEKEKRAPSRNNERNPTVPTVTSIASVAPGPPKLALPVADGQDEAKATNVLLDNFRELAIGCYATSRFQLPEAIRTFRSLPTAQRETSWALAQLGKAYYEAADYKNAEDCFARMMKLQPSRIEDTEVYSTVLWHLKKEPALAFLCHTLRDLDFEAPQTLCAMGNAFSLSRDHDLAISAFKRATQIDENFAYAWTLMGHEYIANEEYDAAISSFRKSVAVDTRGYGGWYGLAKSYERMGKLEEAERYYRIAATINPSNATLLVCIGVVLERLRNKRAALANYTKALELTPNSALARFKKARVLMHLRHFSVALVELEILRDQAPDEANVWFLLGKCYKGLGERSEALRALTTALNLDVKAAPFIKEAMEALDEDDEDDSDDD